MFNNPPPKKKEEQTHIVNLPSFTNADGNKRFGAESLDGEGNGGRYVPNSPKRLEDPHLFAGANEEEAAQKRLSSFVQRRELLSCTELLETTPQRRRRAYVELVEGGLKKGAQHFFYANFTLAD